jgi:hemoglobin/transferrin/lactoferrin receptor protein
MIPYIRPALPAMAMILTAGLAAAQQSANDTDSDGSRYVPPVSVTATKNPVETFDYPGMVTVRDRRDIQERQATSPDDILRTVPGVDFFGGPRRTGEVPSIRGFSGPDVILLLDGARQNFISGHDGQFFVDPLFLRRVEVVKGSSSALYGSGGTGGVIEMRTVDAEDLLAPGGSWGGEVSTGYQGVNKEWTAGVVGAARPSQRFEAVGGLTWLTGGDYRLGDGSTLVADDDIISGLLKTRATLTEHQGLEASWQRFHNDAAEPNNGQSTGSDLVDKVVDTDNFRIAYNNSDPSSRWLDLDAIVYYTDSSVEETRLDNLGAGPAGQVENRELSTIGARIDNRTRFVHSETALTTLTYGAETYRDKGEGSTDGAARGGVPNAESTFAGAFLQGQVEFDRIMGTSASASIIPGLRYDYYTSEGDSGEITSDEVSPKLALQLRPVEPVSLFASYAHAFRAPNLNELFPSGTHFVIPGFGVNSFIPNTALKPQTTRTYEAGMGLQFEDIITRRDRFEMKGAHYWIDGEDFIDIVVVQPAPPACIPPNCNGTTQSVNVANAQLDGFEFEGSYENEAILVEAGFARIDGDNERTGAPLGVVQPDKFTLHFAYKFPSLGLRLGWRYLHASKFDNTNDATLVRDAYDLNDIYASWHAQKNSPLAGLGVLVGVDNLFDRAYTRTASEALEPGRNVKATIRYAIKM